MHALRPPCCCHWQQQRQHTAPATPAAPAGMRLHQAHRSSHQTRVSSRIAAAPVRRQPKQRPQDFVTTAADGNWYASPSPSSSISSSNSQGSQGTQVSSSGSKDDTPLLSQPDMDGTSSSISGTSSGSSKAGVNSRRKAIASSRSRFRRPGGRAATGRQQATAVELPADAEEGAKAETAAAENLLASDLAQPDRNRSRRSTTNNSSSSSKAASRTPLHSPEQPQQQQQQEAVQSQQDPHHQAVQQRTSSDGSSRSSSSAGASSLQQPLSASLPVGQVQQLQDYLDHMLEVNKVMNLTAIRDPQEAWERHIEDSLALLPIIEQYACSSSSTRGSSGSSSTQSSSSGGGGGDLSSSSGPSSRRLTVIDVGTGAGLPGMVLAVVRPHWQVTLLDSLRKRCDFLQQTAAKLGLRNVTVVWSRAEDGARQPDLREGHDVAVARAVAELRVLAELCLPFVAPGGVWVAAKGADPEDEVAAAQKALSRLSGQLLGVPCVQSWAPEGQRTAVVVRKTGRTPQQYPRAPGTPGRKPL